MSETAATPYYQQKVTTLLQEKSKSFYLGLGTILVIVAMFGVVTSQKPTTITGTKKIAKAYLQPSVTPSQRTYTVQESDTLSIIALNQLGNMDRWVEIAKLNNITDINTIVVGQKLIMPSGTLVAQAVSVTPAPTLTIQPTVVPPSATPIPAGQGDIGDTGAMTKKANPNIKEYTVQEGEGLWEIAEKVYGDGQMFTEIMKKNNIKDENAIFPGMKLKMPHVK